MQLFTGTQVSPAASCRLLWPLLQTRQPRHFHDDCPCPVNSGHHCVKLTLPRQRSWFPSDRSGLIELGCSIPICWNKKQVCAELELLMKCDSAAFPYDPMSALRAPSEKQTSCHLRTKPGNSRENFLSEVKLLQRLNLPSPVLLLLYVVFLIILSLHNFQASDSTGSDAVGAGSRLVRKSLLALG